MNICENLKRPWKEWLLYILSVKLSPDRDTNWKRPEFKFTSLLCKRFTQEKKNFLRSVQKIHFLPTTYSWEEENFNVLYFAVVTGNYIQISWILCNMWHASIFFRFQFHIYVQACPVCMSVYTHIFTLQQKCVYYSKWQKSFFTFMFCVIANFFQPVLQWALFHFMMLVLVLGGCFISVERVIHFLCKLPNSFHCDIAKT